MESLKSTFNSIFENIDGNITPIAKEGFKIIEKQNLKFYYSKFTIDSNELMQIFHFINRIKLQTFRQTSTLLKEIIKNKIVTINSDTDKDLILFSAFYLHYYSIFAYESKNSFESFYMKELFDMCKGMGITIINQEIFKSTSLIFYQTLVNIIQKYDYAKIKKMFQYYNPDIINEDSTPFKPFNTNSNKDDPINVLIEHLNNNQKRTKLTNNFLKYLTSTKEHLIDLVLETNQKRKFTRPNGSQRLSNLLTQISTLPQVLNSDDNQNNSLDQMQIDDSIDNVNTSASDTSLYSKRVLTEITKCQVDDETEKSVTEISEHVDELFLDVLLNNCNNHISTIHPFLCYIVEINSDQIRLLPEYKDLKEELTLQFVVTAKNIYYKVLEIYFSLFNLRLFDMTIFFSILKKRDVEIKFAGSFFTFINSMREVIKKEGADWQNKTKLVFDHFLEEQMKIWIQVLKEREQKLTHFCII